jgi:hypothetical protein
MRRRPANTSASTIPRKAQIPNGILEKGPHEIVFPDIEQGMPWVWHSGPLVTRVLTPDREISLRVDGIPVQAEVLDGRSEVLLNLSEGRHVIQIEGASGRTMAAVRIVEYRQEVLEQFSASLERWSSSKRVGPEMSPREVFTVLGTTVPRSRAGGALGVIERAAYSHHPVVRADYKTVLDALFDLGGVA